MLWQAKWLNATTCAPPQVCGQFTGGQSVAGSITTAVPLAPNLANADILASVTDYTFSNGVFTIASGSPQARLEEAVGLYQDSLALVSDDEDAKYNLEFVQREIERRRQEAEERQQQPQQQQDRQQQQQQQQEERQQQPDPAQDGDRDGDEKQLLR